MALFENTFGPYVPFGSRTLSLRSPAVRGTDVAIVQAVWNLMLSTMSPGPIGSQVTINGVFDVATQAAVRSIQTYFGLSADGVAGAGTYFVFGQGVGPNVTYGGPAYGSRELSQGMSGGDVLVAQNRLNLFAPYARLVGGPADGHFGAKTAQAVLAFKADAVANGNTGLAPNSTIGSGAFDSTWLYTFAGGRGLLVNSGRNGFDVVFVQVLLKKLGFYTGAIDGKYGPTTVQAVAAFQRSQGIGADGNVGPATFYRLGLNNPVAAPGPLGIAWPSGVAPSVSVGASELVTQTSDLHPYGGASLVINEAEGFQSLNVVANFLPSPSEFGSQFGAYAFVLVDPATGATFGQSLMTALPGETGDWGGSLSVGVATIPTGTVTVFPTPADSATGPYGPAALGGSLVDCT
jgi:peptidoglycan hydrolase-like protein with peptidoglycan-binding domain